MADEVSILPQWKTLLPAEKVGNSKESLVGQVEKEPFQNKKRRKKRPAPKSDGDEEQRELSEEESKDPETHSGKIVDITV